MERKIVPVRQLKHEKTVSQGKCTTKLCQINPSEDILYMLN